MKFLDLIGGLVFVGVLMAGIFTAIKNIRFGTTPGASVGEPETPKPADPVVTSEQPK